MIDIKNLKYDQEGRIGFTKEMINDDFYKSLDKPSKKRYTSFIKFVDFEKSELDNFEDMIYFRNTDKVKIICKLHGEYYCSPNSYLNGHRCSKCGWLQITKEEYITKIYNKFPNLEIQGKFVDLSHDVNVKCNLCGNIHSIRADKLLSSKYGCKCLSGNKKLTIDEYKLKIKDLKIECLEDYINNSTPILHRCKICNHIWKVRPTSIVNNKTSCPLCSLKNKGLEKRLSLDEVNKRLNERNIICLVYNGLNNISNFKCLKCDKEWFTRSSIVITDGCGCPNCKSSSNEKMIADWLDLHNIQYKREYRFEDCKNINTLPFDFYIEKYNMLIEMQGEQHYKPIKFRKEMTDEESIENFKYRQKLDNIKKSYAIDNGFTFIRISYKDDIRKVLRNIFSFFLPQMAMSCKKELKNQNLL